MGQWLPKTAAAAGGIGLVGFGAWAMVSPSTFFEVLARFEPYNQHFLQDIGALQIGFGAVLLRGGMPRADSSPLHCWVPGWVPLCMSSRTSSGWISAGIPRLISPSSAPWRSSC